LSVVEDEMGTAAITKTRSSTKSAAQKPKSKVMSADEAGKKLYEIIEGHFDEIGLSEEERDKRYDRAQKHLDQINGVDAKP
jgi:hypothetical protein